MRRPDDDQLFDNPRDDDFSAAASATPPEISLLRDYLQLAAVADEPELQQTLVQAQQFGAYLAAVLQAQSREIPPDEDGDNSTKPDSRLNSQADGHSYGQLDRHADAEIPNRLGDFDIFERVDAGGMGAVYRARQRSTGRVVAVKIIAPQRMENVEAQRRFRREGNLTLGLRHPHLVEILDAGEQSGRAYLAMEYLAGRNLRDIAATQAPMAVADACELIRQAALGIDFLARHGFVHRDIKPSNLMLAGKPAQVKVLDLGLACDPGETARSELTQSQQILGTYDYLAPEQARDARAVDGRADIYSLGCTLYRLLAGFAPFARSGGGSLASILVAHQLYTAKALDSLRSDIPAPLADIVARAMRKLPSDRFATAGDFAEALAVYSVGARLDRLVEPWTNATPPDTLTIADESNATKSTDANAFVAGELDEDRPAVVSVDQRTPRIGSVATAAIGSVALLAISLLAYTVLVPVRQRWRQADESPQVATGGAARRSDQKPTAVASSRQSPAHSPQHPPANSPQNSPAFSPKKSPPPPLLREPFPAIAAHESQRSWARYLGLEHIEVINSIGMPLRIVPPGDFAGRPLDRDSRVQQPVLLGVREITEREYERIMGSGGASNSGASKSSESKPSELRDEWPARGIAWHEAIEFCRRLSDLPEERRAGRCYSLPTNALWEWACRAGCDSDMPWNDATLRDHAVANEPAPRRVGCFPGNSFGLVDMRGNVAEWTADWIPQSGMTGASSRVTPFIRPVTRGGSYESETAALLRSTAKRTHFPESPPEPDCGLRVVCRLKATAQRPTRSKRDESGFDPMISRDTALNGWGFPGGNVENVDGVLVESIGAGSDWGSVWYGRHGALRDFELRCDMRVEGPVNECVMLFRANVLETSWETGSHYRFHLAGDRAGWLYRSSPGVTDTIAVAPAELLAQLRFDTWNRLAIRCEGRRVRIWLADELAIDLTDNMPKVCLQGPLSFLLRGSPDGSRRTARFRDLRIRLLDSSIAASPKPLEWTMGLQNLPRLATPQERSP